MTEVAERPAAAAKPEAKPAEKRLVTLEPQRMGLAEHRRQDWAVNAAAGTTIDDVLDPQYWAHMAAQMTPYDRVDVLLETGEWLLELLVLGVGRNWAQVRVLHHHELTKMAETMPAAQKHKVDWKGPQRKYAVIRISDSAIVQDGFGTRGEATAWMDHHEKVTGA
jgi:hypothetical protein